MIEIDFEKFGDQDFVDEGYELYVMKNGSGAVLYVGITTQSIWERWFGWNGHMMWEGNTIYGISLIGQKIVDHLPESLKWKIQLWTLEDCRIFCKDMLPETQSYTTIQFVEPLMIQKLSPSLNVTFNLNPGKDTTPKSKQEKKREETLDNWYDKIFNKK
jgi:hypothetical protein